MCCLLNVWLGPTIDPDAGAAGGSGFGTTTSGERFRAMSTREPDPRNSPLPPEPEVPGGAAALPANSLPKPFLGPQGDENRNPPPDAPAPTLPTETVKDVGSGA
jgi:hypothetical protein